MVAFVVVGRRVFSVIGCDGRLCRWLRWYSVVLVAVVADVVRFVGCIYRCWRWSLVLADYVGVVFGGGGW